jgi:hypothetical protein
MKGTYMLIKFNKVSLFLAAISLVMSVSTAVLAGEYSGTSWLLNDTNGDPFEITLSKDGTAAGTHQDAMKHGTWKEGDGAVVINWNTGWTTRITKQGDKYVKTAFKPGVALSGTPTNSSEARKKE